MVKRLGLFVLFLLSPVSVSVPVAPDSYIWSIDPAVRTVRV